MRTKHKDCKRQFIHLARAWHVEGNLRDRTDGLVDEINIGLYHPDGGTTGEFSIRWEYLYGTETMRLSAYDDAWSALAEFRDMLDGLAELDDKNATAEQICELLVRCGVEDVTPVESPYGAKEAA